jgi:type IV pilus assembly protein PilB
MAGINQVLVRQDIGLTFARALRAFLRQDPDIIMVGKSETARRRKSRSTLR